MDDSVDGITSAGVTARVGCVAVRGDVRAEVEQLVITVGILNLHAGHCALRAIHDEIHPT